MDFLDRLANSALFCLIVDGCAHDRSWPLTGKDGVKRVTCRKCGASAPYDWENMRVTRNPPIELSKADREFLAQPPCIRCSGPGKLIGATVICDECLDILALLSAAGEG